MSNSVYPCLWFNNNAKEAADFYCSVFKNSRILQETPMVVSFEINGTRFMGLNGGPNYTFSPATSFVIECASQEEIDYYWEWLGKDGRYSMCGWLDDKFGVSWQVIPAILPKLMADAEKAPRILQAFMNMQKFEIEKLVNA